MTQAHFTFDHYAEDGNHLLKLLAQRLGDPENTLQAQRILRTVLHGIRDALPPAEALAFMSQLPVIIKGIFVEGWKISQPHRFKKPGEFAAYIRSLSGNAAGRDFGTDQELEGKIKEVFHLLDEEYFSDGQVDRLKNVLPEHLRTLFD
jgi:uncharacterized protein (DUF2267 family)